MVEAKSKKMFYFLAFILPCLVLYMIFFITPFFRGVGISLTNWDGLTPKTPIILAREEFESKILFSSKINKNERNYIQEIYFYDPVDESYKRKNISGGIRRKLERIVGKTGYHPERNKFVGLENYKKIFTGKIDKKFYPRIDIIEKFTKTSELPGFISKDDFEKQVLKGGKVKNSDIVTLKSAYELDGSKKRYKLKKIYDEFDILTPLYELIEITELKSLSESEIESFIQKLKAATIEHDEYKREKLIQEFSVEKKLSKDSVMEIYQASDDLVKVAYIKDALASAWVVKTKNMGVIGFTFFFAIFSVIGINSLAFILALALDTGIRGQKVLRTVFFLPNVLSMIIVALIWSMLFVQLLPTITGVEKWISDPAKTPWLLILVAVWQGCGYYMIVYLAGLQNISTDVIEAAKIDGATGWQRFRYITLPLMIPSLTISLFLTIANALKSFDLIYAMIGQTGYATGTVPFVMDIYFDAFSLKEAGMATAKAMVLFFVIVFVTGIQLYTMKKKEIEA